VTGRRPAVGVAGGMAAFCYAQATPGVSPSEDTSTPSITGRVDTARAWTKDASSRDLTLPEACTPGHPCPYSIPACAACLAPATGARRHGIATYEDPNAGGNMNSWLLLLRYSKVALHKSPPILVSMG
jgi:hypothetical protein